MDLPRMMTSSPAGYYEALLARWFPATAKQTEPISFTENDVREIAIILKFGPNRQWSRIPRIYIILRKIDQLDAIEGFLRDSITDFWFPFTQKSLPHSFTDSSARLRFLQAQDGVFSSQTLELERPGAGHGHFRNESDIPLRKVGDLGKGASGYVERVLSTITHREYALKLLPRGKNFRQNKEVLREFEQELSNMKRLLRLHGHRHIVSFVGSYTDPKYVGILMSPVADYHLGKLLEHPEIEQHRWRLRSYFGCLVSALCFLHDHNIRHKDIKPSNILVKDGEVYITDFGLSLDWSEFNYSETSGRTTVTPRYAAPEVIAYEKRNSSSDIWSLGCVYLEIWTVLKKGSLADLRAHLGAGHYHSTSFDLAAWIAHMEALPGPPSDNLPILWIRKMLQRERDQRLVAHVISEMIQDSSTDDNTEYLYIGRCCLTEDDDIENATFATDGYQRDILPRASADLTAAQAVPYTGNPLDTHHAIKTLLNTSRSIAEGSRTGHPISPRVTEQEIKRVRDIISSDPQIRRVYELMAMLLPSKNTDALVASVTDEEADFAAQNLTELNDHLRNFCVKGFEGADPTMLQELQAYVRVSAVFEEDLKKLLEFKKYVVSTAGQTCVRVSSELEEDFKKLLKFKKDVDSTAGPDTNTREGS